MASLFCYKVLQHFWWTLQRKTGMQKDELQTGDYDKGWKCILLVTNRKWICLCFIDKPAKFHHTFSLKPIPNIHCYVSIKVFNLKLVPFDWGITSIPSVFFTHSIPWCFGWFPSQIPCANQHRSQMQLPAVLWLWYWATTGSPGMGDMPSVLKVCLLCLVTDPLMMALPIGRIEHYTDITDLSCPPPSLKQNHPAHDSTSVHRIVWHSLLNC